MTHASLIQTPGKSRPKCQRAGETHATAEEPHKSDILTFLSKRCILEIRRKKLYFWGLKSDKEPDIVRVILESLQTILQIWRKNIADFGLGGSNDGVVTFDDHWSLLIMIVSCLHWDGVGCLRWEADQSSDHQDGFHLGQRLGRPGDHHHDDRDHHVDCDQHDDPADVPADDHDSTDQDDFHLEHCLSGPGEK